MARTLAQSIALDKLARLAGWDLDLVQSAIRASSDRGRPAHLEHVVSFILHARKGKRPSRPLWEIH